MNSESPSLDPKPNARTEDEGIYRRKYVPYLLVWFVGILARVPFYLAFNPIWNNDSPGYVIPYFLWRNHRFFWGARTPVYPLFLGFTQWLAGVHVITTFPVSASYNTVRALAVLSIPTAYVTVCLQSAMDIAAVCILYFTMEKLSVRKSVALVTSIFAVTTPALCMMEIQILNLSLSFAALSLCALVFTGLVKRVNGGSRFVLWSVLCGLLFSCTSLLRPENLIFCAILVSVLMGAWTVSKLRGGPSFCGNSAPIATLLIIASAAPLILAWMTWNYVGIGEFRITTLTGWNRSKTVYNIFDRVEPEDRVLGETLAASYLQRNHDGIVVRDHVWQAQYDLWDRYTFFPLTDPTETPSAFHLRVDRALEEGLGMKARIPCEEPDQLCFERLRKLINIGDYVGAVSWKLTKKYPGVYLANVTGNFLDTFSFRYLDSTPAAENSRITAVDGGDYIRYQRLARFLPISINSVAPLLTGLYIILFGFVVFAPVVLMSTFGERRVSDIIVSGLALATVGTFLGMCALSGFNREYSIPHLGVMMICTAYAVDNWRRAAASVGLRSAEASQTDCTTK